MDEKSCPRGIYIFQELGLDKVDFDLISEIEVSKNYFDDLRWLIRKFKLTMTIWNPSKKFQYQNGNLIKTKYSTGYWEIFKYDHHGNKIFQEYSIGHWKKISYNDKGYIIKVESSNNYWEKYEYDKNGNEIKSEDSNGYWEKFEYDKNNNLIKYEDSNGYWEKYEYDENNDLIKIDCSSRKNYKKEIKDLKESLIKQKIIQEA